MRNAYKILVCKRDGKRTLRKPLYNWEDSIEMDLGKCDLRVSIGFIWLRIGTSDYSEPLGSINGGEFVC
jgi:hypothetical protein